MSKFAITKDMSRSERMAAIKKAADRFNAKMQRNFKVRDYTTTPKEERTEFDTHNINAYTDGSKYLNEHYGDRVRDQNSYESNDGWN